jgi:hypothetical protein
VPDFDEQLAAVRGARPEAELLIDGTGPGNPVRWVYVDGGAARGAVIELLERTPTAEAAFGPALELVAGRRRLVMPGHDITPGCSAARRAPRPRRLSLRRHGDPAAARGR